METPNTDPTPPPPALLEAAMDLWDQARGQHLIPITGRSMQPLIQDGDRVLVAHGIAGVRRGDVVVFRREGRLIAHRVLRIYHRQPGRVFITKGDGIRRFDPPVHAGEVLGRVLTVERNGWQMSLDTLSWHAAGWLIAVGTLSWTTFYGWSRGLKRRLVGSRPSRLTVILNRGATACASLAFKIVQAALCRWEA